MAKWTRDRVDSESLNNGNEFSIDSQVALEELNAIINAGLYSQDFVENLTEGVDISDANNVGIPTVSFVDYIKNGKTFKKFKFSNIKGQPGPQGPKGEPGIIENLDTELSETSENGVQNKVIKAEFNKYLSLSGGNMNGQLSVNTLASIDTNGYVTGTWLRTTDSTEASSYNGIAVLNNGLVYHRSLANLKSDLGVPTNNNQLTNGAGYLTAITSSASGSSSVSSGKYIAIGGVKLSNGLIINWGMVNPSSSGTTVGFLEPFTTSYYSVGATNYNSASNQIRALAVTSYSTTGFVCYGQYSQNNSGYTGGDVTYRYIAIGY